MTVSSGQAPPAPPPTTGTARHRRRRPHASERTRAERRFGWLLCAPAVIVMLGVTAFPIAYAVYLSLEKIDLRFPERAKFIGIQNYETVLTSGLWWHALVVTVVITIVSVAIEFVLGMGVAMLMHRTLFARGTLRTSVLVPYGIVTVVAAYSWQYAWTPGTGYLANLIPGSAAPLTNTYAAVGLIILAEVWKTTPFMALLLLAGLSLVPEELLNAAKVDGASAWQRFIRITVPIMKPAILVALLFRTLDAFRIFDNIYILTGGNHGTESVSILNYNNIFQVPTLGLGSAMSILITIAVAIIAVAFVKGFGTAAPGQEVK
jgi:multiple sugar transport system permease protein